MINGTNIQAFRNIYKYIKTVKMTETYENIGKHRTVSNNIEQYRKT